MDQKLFDLYNGKSSCKQGNYIQKGAFLCPKLFNMFKFIAEKMAVFYAPFKKQQ